MPIPTIRDMPANDQPPSGHYICAIEYIDGHKEELCQKLVSHVIVWVTGPNGEPTWMTTCTQHMGELVDMVLELTDDVSISRLE